MADREALGRLVREVWVEWASEQPDPKPSWLLPWEDLDDGQREVDMRIGEAVAAHAVAEIAGQRRPPRTKRAAQNPWTREQESRTCRSCGAQPGRECVTASGTRAPRPHAARFNDANDAKAHRAGTDG